jgi:nitroreductase
MRRIAITRGDKLDFIEAVEGRRSIRKFLQDPIPRADLEEIFRIGTLAPSASNMQMWRFIAVTDKQTLKKMEKAILAKVDEIASWPEAKDVLQRIEGARVYATHFAKAPCGIAVFGEPYGSAMDDVLALRGFSQEDRERVRPRPDIQSIGAAIQNILLAAYSKGYGTVWMTAPCIAAREIERILGVKDPWKLTAVIAMGKPDESPAAKPRKPLREVLQLIE